MGGGGFRRSNFFWGGYMPQGQVLVNHGLP